MTINNKSLPSNKKFGALFTCIFAAVFIYFYWLSPSDLSSVFAVVAIIFAIVTIFASSLLAPFNKAWFSLSLLMGKFVSPIVLGIIFFLLITPVAIITRLFGRDELLIKKREVPSYWIEKEAIDPDSFKDQF
jgi:hypothetical protein